MTRKDYVAIATALNRTYPAHRRELDGKPDEAVAQWQFSVDAIADVLAEDNPRFDRDRFLKACVA